MADTLVIINAASNFAIYCVSGRKFREIFSQTFLGRGTGNTSSGHSGSRSSDRIKIKLKTCETHTIPKDESSDGRAAVTERHLSVDERSCNKLLAHAPMMPCSVEGGNSEIENECLKGNDSDVIATNMEGR